MRTVERRRGEAESIALKDMVGGRGVVSGGGGGVSSSVAGAEGVLHDLGRDARERVVRRRPTSARDKVSGRGYGGDRGCAFGRMTRQIFFPQTEGP